MVHLCHEHEMDLQIDFCICCGLSREEIENKLLPCWGYKGTVSIKFIQKAAEAKKIFGPVVDYILKGV